MTKFLSTFLLAVGILFLTVLGLDYAMAIPEVQQSWSTKECVGVTTYQGVFFDSLGYSCENMPEKYNHVWVK